ncbi:MAG TPA: hypothetical protein VFW79_09850 [Cellulomonas sp.]|uniref:hypothetical protein n=1 Tax=Cellulomonas sp. TaxID=40001 RepID=UPI002E338EC7|nr:hypothetical protein [Cellulomonas sp.]HEX5332934.1 hypothetical protein [Cellulomonas sp.]
MTGSRSPRASRVVVVLAWALAVLVAGAVTSWAVMVISGEQGPARDRVLAASQVTAELAAQRAVPTATTAPPVPSVAPNPEPSSASPAPPPTPSAAASQIPSQIPSQVPSQVPSTAAAEVARTWDVKGGQVGASCRGTVLTLLYATPADGWTMEVKRAASDELEVAFHQGEAETTVHATCVAGVPETQADTDADEH